MDNLPNIDITLLPSQYTDGFIVQVAGLNGQKVEDRVVLRGGNIYPLSGHTDKFTIIPIFPPIVHGGSLHCVGTNYELKWFIDSYRNIYLIDSFGSGFILKGGEWVKAKSTSLATSIDACNNFLEWVESEHKRIEKEDALVQTLIIINDDDAKDFPNWLTEIPFFMDRWLAYKAQNLTLHQLSMHS